MLYLDQSNESKQYGDLVFGFHLGNRRLWRCTLRCNCDNIQTSKPTVQLPFSEQCRRKSKRRRLPITDSTCNNGFQSLSSPNINIPTYHVFKVGLRTRLFRPTQCSNCPKGGGGWKFFFRWGLRDEVGGRNFFRHGVEKEVGGRILSSIIEERGNRHKNQVYSVSLLLEIGSKEAHAVCHSNI